MATPEEKPAIMIPLNGRYYTVEEATILSARACKFRNSKAAIDIYNHIITAAPDHLDSYCNRGAILWEMGRHEGALADFDKAITLNPGYAEAYNSRGNILMCKGNVPEAERMFRKAAALKPDSAIFLFSLVNARKYQDTNHADIKAIESLLYRSTTSLQDKEILYFALGKIYDDCSLHEEAFYYYQQANRLRSAAVTYNAKEVTEFSSGIINIFSQKFLSKPFAFASDSEAPVFVVGMPRSGTTLMASILSNHPSIATAGELPNIREMILRLPELIEPASHLAKQASPPIAEQLVELYEKRLRRDTDPGALHVIDKHPLNFRYLGFILMLFPKARIIHCTRNPLDTALSNYFQRFSLDYGYAFDLNNIGHFYEDYRRIMTHWRNVLPCNRMIEISYEEMIMNTELVVQRTLGFIGVEWDKRCLTPHTNPCMVETASQWQVRQPMLYRIRGTLAAL